MKMTDKNWQYITGPARIRIKTGDEATGIDDCGVLTESIGKKDPTDGLD